MIAGGNSVTLKDQIEERLDVIRDMKKKAFLRNNTESVYLAGVEDCLEWLKEILGKDSKK